MATIIPKNIITAEYAKIIQQHLTIYPIQSVINKYNKPPPIMFYQTDEEELSLPYFYGRKIAALLKYKISSLIYPAKNFEFTQTLLEIQKEIIPDIMSQLEQHRTTTLNLYTGFGKTVIGAYLASKLNLLTLIVYHRDILKDQWNSTFRDFTSAKIYIYGQPFTKIEDYDVILSMDTKVSTIPKEIRQKIGTVILDEAHCLCTPSRVKTLLSLRPKYLIAATATLKRADGVESMIHFMCGPHKVERISYKPFTVHKLNTKIKFEIPKNVQGKADWNQIVTNLIQNDQRNQLIYQLVEINPQHKILILTWRKEHVKTLHNELLKKGEKVDFMAGRKKSYQDSRILIGTISKIGTGFDEKTACASFSGIRINLLIFVGTMKSETLIEQTSGRVFRAGNPNIVMLVDDLPITKNHWRIARKWYQSRNGTIHEH